MLSVSKLIIAPYTYSRRSWALMRISGICGKQKNSRCQHSDSTTDPQVISSSNSWNKHEEASKTHQDASDLSTKKDQEKQKKQKKIQKYVNDIKKQKLDRLHKSHSKTAVNVAEFYVYSGHYDQFMKRLKYFEVQKIPVPEQVHGIIIKGLYTQGKFGAGLHHCLRCLRCGDAVDAPALTYALACGGRLAEAEDDAASAEIINKISTIVTYMEEKGQSLEQVLAASGNRGTLVGGAAGRALALARPHAPPPRPVAPCSRRAPRYPVPLLDALEGEQEYSATVNRSLPVELPRNPLFAGVDAVEEQMAIESEVDVLVESVAPNLLNREESEVLELWKRRWREQLTHGVTLEMSAAKEKFQRRSDKNFNGGHVYPILASVGNSALVDIMMHELECVSGQESRHNCQHARVERVGYNVLAAYSVARHLRAGSHASVRDAHAHYCERLALREGDHRVPRLLYEQLFSDAHLCGEHLQLHSPSLNCQLMNSVGKFVYGLMMRHLLISLPLEHQKLARIPLLSEETVGIGYKKLRMVTVPEQVRKLMPRSKHLRFLSRELPMLCPPAPWTSHRHGGYLLRPPPPLLRLPDNALDDDQQTQLLEEQGCHSLNAYMDSLNQLGATAWRVNAPVLDVILELFRTNSGASLDIAPCPSTLPQPASNSKEERDEYRKVKSEMYSLWSSTLYKLSIANHMRGRTLWFPHNMDFRGRAYSIPPHLNHLNSDVFRSLLHFGESKKLGKDGLRWLKIHIINLSGKAKTESIAYRLKMCEDCLEEIKDSAERPLTGQRWWTTSDEPWQTLAACMELTAALSLADPTQHESRLAIHQDGSCNGLQHYAALGKDTLGATSVNLMPGERPADVYSDVAEMVKKTWQVHVKDPSCPEHAAAKLLRGRITRKIVKPTVMTSVYGVTNFGAQLQIRKTIKDAEWEGMTPQQINMCANYLATMVFKSLNETFESATSIQDWLTECAIAIMKMRMTGVSWVTPLGMKVIQPYYVNQTKKELENIMERQIAKDKAVFRNPIYYKQRNGFAPNFIHSLDASHMMMTSLHCQKQDITFASVHDCFWTHACSVDAMNKITREQFVALYSTPIIEDLAGHILENWGFVDQEFADDGSVSDGDKYRFNHLVGFPPEKGDFDVNKVKDSTFFFS